MCLVLKMTCGMIQLCNNQRYAIYCTYVPMLFDLLQQEIIIPVDGSEGDRTSSPDHTIRKYVSCCFNTCLCVIWFLWSDCTSLNTNLKYLNCGAVLTIVFLKVASQIFIHQSQSVSNTSGISLHYLIPGIVSPSQLVYLLAKQICYTKLIHTGRYET